MTTESNIVLASKEFKVVGKRPVRPDGADKVTGRARYGADVNMAGLLHGKILRSPHAHARIISIDTSAAEAHPDVWAVATWADLATPQDRIRADVDGIESNFRYLSNNVLAEDRVLYVGHPVVAVAAASPQAAEEALKLIDVQYEPLDAVIDIDAALAPGAPLVHQNPVVPVSRPSEFDGTNIASHTHFEHGDVEKGFAEADVIVEREYRTATVHQGYIEPQNATALWSEDGHLTIWCSNQGHFGVRHEVAELVGLPVSAVTVVPMEIGGGFGGKITAFLEPVAAVLSHKTDRPVKLVMDRSEVFQATGPTCASIVRAKVGATKDGRITAAQAYIAFEAGAYPGSFVENACNTAFASYDLANVLVDGYDVCNNKPRTGAYRSPGGPNAAIAAETVVDELASELGIDQVEFRLLNAATEGSRRTDGTLYPRIGMVEVAEAVRGHAHYNSGLPQPSSAVHRVGRGFAMGYSGNVAGEATVVASVVADGTVKLLMGSVDIGGTRASIAQQFGEVLGIGIESINPTVGDTDTAGYTGPSAGSSASHKSGWAAYEAGLDVKRQLIKRAALIWGVSEDQVEFSDGAAFHKTDSELRMSLPELAALLHGTGGPITGRGNVNRGGFAGSFSANLVDLQVDTETGKVDILRYTVFQDAGKAIHPSYVEGQMQGGTVQGIGWALNEEYVFDADGRMQNPTLLDYRMPTTWDVPMIDTVIIEVANPGHPYGARGVGESSIVPPLPAISNAINNAVGIRVPVLPMSPGNIIAELNP
jgi:xanthine dehydrogenase molybdenum-binding subunit